MTASLHIQTSHPHFALAALRGYLAEVTHALGIGLESCTLDHDTPVSAYVALDEHLPGYPGRDVALLWDEVRGWAAAIETHSGGGLAVIRYLGGTTVIPPPARVARFVAALREDDHRVGRLDPPSIRTAAGLAELEAVLRVWRCSPGVRAGSRPGSPPGRVEKEASMADSTEQDTSQFSGDHHGWAPDIDSDAGGNTAAEGARKARQTPDHEPGSDAGTDHSPEGTLSSTDMEPESPYGSGDSTSRGAEEIALDKGREASRRKGVSQRPYGRAESEDATGIGQQ